MSVTVLGIDPSLTNTGLCWGDGEFWDAQCFPYRFRKGTDSKAIENRVKRIDDLTLKVECLLEVKKPAMALIESYSFGSRNGGEYLGEYGGMLRSMLMKNVSKVVEVAPTMVKKFATGKGNAKKEVIIGHVQKRWNCLMCNSDEADAYVLYRIGLCYAGICEPENQAQREVLAKLKG